LRVLVIEDNRDGAELLQTMLELLGHDVEIALTGAEGVRLAGQHRPDLVLCDLGLPGMDGFEVAASLRAQDDAPHRLVAVTGYGQPEDRRRTREAGFHDHLVKPIDPAQLRALLGRMADDLPK
jgi:CheY-like chemotaxis protein